MMIKIIIDSQEICYVSSLWSPNRPRPPGRHVNAGENSNHSIEKKIEKTGTILGWERNLSFFLWYFLSVESPLAFCLASLVSGDMEIYVSSLGFYSLCT